uniref:Uncharacterized protein n=2 Tax=Sphaerodactylus townsendi TaxID=933632 RepID=A0ACB8FCK3_9SAUR
MGLDHLEWLSLEMNNLSSLDSLLSSSLPGLKTLKVSNNRLESIPVGLFDSWGKLSSVALSGNPWRCDCRLLYLHSWMRNNASKVQDANKAVCGSPEDLAGKEVSGLTEGQLICVTTTPSSTMPIPVATAVPSATEISTTAGAASTPLKTPTTASEITTTTGRSTRIPQTTSTVKTTLEITSVGHTTASEIVTTTERSTRVPQTTPTVKTILEITPTPQVTSAGKSHTTASETTHVGSSVISPGPATEPSRTSMAAVRPAPTPQATSPVRTSIGTLDTTVWTGKSLVTTTATNQRPITTPALEITPVETFSSMGGSVLASTPGCLSRTSPRNECPSSSWMAELATEQERRTPTRAAAPFPSAETQAEASVAGVATTLPQPAMDGASPSPPRSSRPTSGPRGTNRAPSSRSLLHAWGFSLSSSHRYCPLFLTLYLSVLLVEICCAVALARFLCVLCNTRHPRHLPSGPIKLTSVQHRKWRL